MKRFFQALAVLVGIWLLSSFVGVVADPSRVNLWTQSLMWALLASITLAPIFLFFTPMPSSKRQQQSSSSEKSFGVEDSVDVGDTETTRTSSDS